MRLNFTKIIVAAVFSVAILGSCTSKTEKLIRSRDYNRMYYRALEHFEDQKYYKATVLLSSCTPYLAGTPKEDSAAYFLSTAYYKRGDFESSTRYFNDFRRRYARSIFLEDVEYMNAMSYYYATLPANRDQTASHSAIKEINEYLERYPNSIRYEVLVGYVEELTQRLHDREYLNAKVYYDIGQYRAAIVALQNAIDKYPESSHREELMYLILSSHHIFASNSLEHLQRDRYLSMMDAYYSYTAEYPEGEERRNADRMQEDARKFLAKYNTDNENGSEEE